MSDETLTGLEARAHALLGKQLWQHGLFGEAVIELDRAIALVADTGWRIRRAILMPPVPRSVEEIAALRNDCQERLSTLLGETLELGDPVKQIDWTPYLLSYHGTNSNRILNAMFHRVCSQASPDLEWQAPHCRAPRAAGRPRIAFISWFFNEHTISRLFGGLIEQLDSEAFDVTVFAFEGNDSFLRQGDLRGKRAVTLPADLRIARETIAAHQPDLLVYLELGMDPFTLFLAHSRLARTQAVLWGHPDTTGIPAIDIFLSCQAMEPEDTADHYGERLVPLPGPGCWYRRPEVATTAMSAMDFGLPDDALLYLCPQTPQKFHPDFDQVIRRILAANDRAHLVLTAGWAPPLMALVRERIVLPAPELAARIHILGAMDRSHFIGLMQVCDILLDPLHYSGGNTSLEAFACGAPVVTWPGRFMRARHTFGFYKLMGVTDCIATDIDSYVEIAIALGRDKAKRDALRQSIRERSRTLYEDDMVVRAFEAFAISTTLSR
ncbi:hypothetical protein [Telmatospirillum sp.]|uniref:O-linked N-acetylglucosamine transferase family protein n=1 Tax=Telmatospirillum sp. TaxID=2079197 RepID=UPI00284F788C|nr:hypothetical protein [Telmatospirillum sp.]MDR3438544.1 hypothetical protein [Telmatospirillum sp.]